MPQPPLTKGDGFTYVDYLGWTDGERWELIDGVAYAMTPAPSRLHQEISGELFLQFASFLRRKKCRIFAAPFDVRLPEPGDTDETTDTVVQPDLVVVCEPAKLDDRGCRGAPDLVIEILSPETANRDLKEKFLLYQKAGVKEYWVVHPTDRTVMAFTLGKGNAYGAPSTFIPGDQAPVATLPGLRIDLSQLFASVEPPKPAPGRKPPPARAAKPAKTMK
jgi:Uma2 family endonuclease